MDNMKTVADRVIIEPLPAQEKIGSIAIHASKRRPQKGKVLGHGLDCRVVTNNCEVLYQVGAGVEIEIDGKNIVFMRESDLLAVL